jgi:hypothetical protein
MVFALVLLSKNTPNNTKKTPGTYNKKKFLANTTKPRPTKESDSGN